MLAYGGNPTGRKSKFIFQAGTSAGDAERRLAESDRKKAARAVADKLREPAALPSANGVDATPPPADGESSLLGAAVPVAVAAWQPQMLQELTDALIDSAEEARVDKWTGKVREAKLPEKLQREVSADAKFPAPAKRGLKLSLPHAAAHALNKTGLGSEYQHEVCCVTCLAAILVQGRRLSAKLDELIESSKPAEKEPLKPIVL